MTSGPFYHGEVVPPEYTAFVQPHVDSFDYFVDEGMDLAVSCMEPIEIQNPITKTVSSFWFEEPSLSKPIKEDAGANYDPRLLPRECREAGTTYKGPFTIRFCWSSSDGASGSILKRLGALPIMTRSSACHLNGMSRSQLVDVKEEANEMGGYFICNGLERIIRCLVQQRRHYVMALRRGAYQKRGANYTPIGTLVRCVRPDQSSATVRCHYLKDGTVNFAFTLRRAEFFIPVGVLLKCFLETSDRELYNKIMAGASSGSGHAAFVSERAELLLQQAAKLGLKTRVQCLEYLGSHFRIILELPSRMTDLQVGQHLLRQFVFIHLDHAADKMQLLLHMLHKLYALANSACCEDNPDALTHHELLLPGHLLVKFLREKLEDCLNTFKELVAKDLERAPERVNLQDEAEIKKYSEKMPDVGKKFEYLLNTGNLVSRSGLDLSQASGFTVVAEKLNFFRYLSHFRSVHRGAYFAELRTTTVRKLLPESWGFFCPVHTPDGAPCGLLNHFTAACKIVTHGPDSPDETEAAMMQVLSSLGMIPSAPAMVPPAPPAYIPVLLDGKVVGCIRSSAAALMVSRLRAIKAAVLAISSGQEDVGCEEDGMGEEFSLGPGDERIPAHLEIAHIPYEQGGPYPGVFMFTQAARMVRPVKQVGGTEVVELVGTLEQNSMHIACPDGGHNGSPGLKFTHSEMHAGAMLSVVASMTPFSDYNQSPRNMYQCQMAKQTMGTPLQALTHRTDTKLYRLQTPQAPIARTAKYSQYHMNEYPNGTNAVVAVLAHTGYDMEDAMILNKSAVDRGLAHALLYKTEMIDLRDEKGKKSVLEAEPHDARSRVQPFVRPVGAFGQRLPQNVPSDPSSTAVLDMPRLDPKSDNKEYDHIGPDGLPHVGAVVWPAQNVYHTKDTITGRYHAHKLKGEEIGYVDQVTLVGTKDGKGNLRQRANIKMRYNRNPVIGDKFASRHGQKGVLSIKWPDVDMPFSASTGMRPDLIINPHAFPSRMTIGMLVESLASKAGALRGEFVDATPFQRCDGKPGNPAEEYGKHLEKLGFARHGQETMISGLTGEEMPCDIFVGLVYYQRLRHMVSDKFQVRSIGPNNQLTKQPIKGRKFGGGIRLGEMERDSLLAHGAAYILHDRLHSCSDYHVMDVCAKCGSLVAPLNMPHAAASVTQGMMIASDGRSGTARVICPVCDNSSKHIERVAMPYVFKYLATELAAMNIKVCLEVGQ
ncbi:hypothetical protein CEUSTIGMA_g10954.t1 [Chlamydomonas eustigma]|uniref:DNA-directed RNA polymerase subunit beta n=1 Tax=Chlamydomonas eustigma TaxID=1157962 RepID=A0A250XKT3_9CHLO|nr:hypothetical protein CEUSTIGMA_g10954.t1 [Chlamydomonas eustigma]|eukprot:GAX83529.1 hypothetical protein CEUSTIGMA_g10954.t1 [Chlamydomonas eustigma]